MIYVKGYQGVRGRGRVRVCMRACVRVCVCVFVCVCACVSVYMHACMHACVPVYLVHTHSSHEVDMSHAVYTAHLY